MDVTKKASEFLTILLNLLPVTREGVLRMLRD
jgi:hypothetical protein